MNRSLLAAIGETSAKTLQINQVFDSAAVMIGEWLGDTARHHDTAVATANRSLRRG
jgi:hypothetical protein